MRFKRRFSKDDFELTFLAAPTVLWFLAFCYLPMFGIIIAFKQFRPMPGAGFIESLLKSKFMGLDNFKFLFSTPDAWIMFRNTILYNIVFIVLGTFVTVALALMISQLRSKKMRKISQTSMFLPHFLSWVVVSYFVFAFLSTENGLMSKLLEMNGSDPVQWYMMSEYWPYILVLVYLWKSIGYGMVIYLAGISGIDESLYEAAIMDGSTKWQQVKYITLPLLQPIIIILFILAVGRIFSTDFGLFYQVPRNSGPLVDVTQTIDVYVYKALTGLNNIGFASAAGLLQSVLGLITILIANWIVKRINSENSLF